MLFASLEPGGKSRAQKDAFCTFTIIPLTLSGDDVGNMARSSPMYSELKEDSASSSSLLSEPEDGVYEQGPTKRQWTTGRWVAVLISSLLFTNIASILITSKAVLSRHSHLTVFEPPTGIPPFFRNISLELRPELIYAPFYDRSDSIYRKHNSPETELAWRELTQLGACLGLVRIDACAPAPFHAAER